MSRRCSWTAGTEGEMARCTLTGTQRRLTLSSPLQNMYDAYQVKLKEHSTADSFSQILRVNLPGSSQANAFKRRQSLRQQEGNRGTNRALICSRSSAAKQQFSLKIHLSVNRGTHGTEGSGLTGEDFPAWRRKSQAGRGGPFGSKRNEEGTPATWLRYYQIAIGTKQGPFKSQPINTPSTTFCHLPE